MPSCKDRKPDSFLLNRAVEEIHVAVHVWITTIPLSQPSCTLTDGDNIFQACCNARLLRHNQVPKIICKFLKLKAEDPIFARLNQVGKDSSSQAVFALTKKKITVCLIFLHLTKGKLLLTDAGWLQDVGLRACQ